jgi:hypothetical protein
MFARLSHGFAATAAAAFTLTASLAASAARTHAAQAGSEFPYVAYVVAPDSYVRSGPGREHYPTGQLPAGYAVEVYRHDGAGWCAIRPPEGSFSLVPLQQLRMIDDRTAQITGDNVVARVGGTLGDQHSAVQVMLKRGETVALAEKPSPTNPWVRIAPPAGEFRWISARRLSRTPPTETASLATNSGGFQGNAFARGASSRAPSPFGADDADVLGGDAFAHLRAGGQNVVTAAPVTTQTLPEKYPFTMSAPVRRRPGSPGCPR